MFEWLFNDNIKNQTPSPPPAELSNYIILQKMKYFEGEIAKNINKITTLEMENKELKMDIIRLKKSNQILYDKTNYLEDKLNTCIVLEPLTPGVIVEPQTPPPNFLKN